MREDFFIAAGYVLGIMGMFYSLTVVVVVTWVYAFVKTHLTSH